MFIGMKRVYLLCIQCNSLYEKNTVMFDSEHNVNYMVATSYLAVVTGGSCYNIDSTGT